MRLEVERREECDRLEAQKNQELERLQNRSELELQAAKERLEELRESVQKQMEREEQTLRSDTRVFLILNCWFRTSSGKSPFIPHPCYHGNPFSREQNLHLLKELRDRLEAEREAERRRLEAQKVLEMDRLQAELEQELQAERRKLQEETEDQRAAIKKVLWTFSAQASTELKDQLQWPLSFLNPLNPEGEGERGLEEHQEEVGPTQTVSLTWGLCSG